MWVFGCYFIKAGIIASQVCVKEIIKYFIDIVIPEYIILLFIA
jgi:hypothetical protein